MNRRNFIGGLTVMVLLLLSLGGFGVVATRDLTTDVERIIAGNYDAIRHVRELRAGLMRINTRYLHGKTAGQLPAGQGPFDVESAALRERIDALRRASALPGEIELVDRVETLADDYLRHYRQLFFVGPRDTARFTALSDAIAGGTEAIAQLTQELAELNERAIFARRDAAAARGRRLGRLALGLAGVSLAVGLYLSVRLTRGVFAPLRRLRDSIRQLRERRFDAVAPVEGGEELAQIAGAFNGMAGELRAYAAESDQRATEASRTSRAILEALPYPVYIADADYAVQLMNPRAERLSAALQIPGALPGAVRKCIDDAAALGRELVGDDLRRAVELPESGEPGAPVPTYLPQVFRMAAAPGATAGWAVLLVDVTQLRQFDQAKTKAISTLGHEVKTPVTSIRMTLHLLLEEKIGPLTADQRELVAAGRDDCERLLAVLQALLELARFESGRVPMKLVPTPPADLLAQAEAMHGSYVRGSEATVMTEGDVAALPPVQADALHVVRVLGNFVSNAVKYRTPGTPVALRAERRADGFVRLSVRNRTARPLSEAEQMKIFDPFYRRAEEHGEGAGLGLTICREIALAHGGRAGVFCDGGQVEFYLDLRIAAAAAGHGAA